MKDLFESDDPRIISIIYPSLNKCLASFFGCNVGDLKSVGGFWETAEADGSVNRIHNQDAIKHIRKNKQVWGFVENKEILHYWVGENVTMEELVMFFAHEFGHLVKPFHRTDAAEEMKANKYADIAYKAYNAATEYFDKVKGNKRGNKRKTLTYTLRSGRKTSGL